MDPIITTSTGIWAYVPKSALDQMSLLDIDPMAGIHAACNRNRCKAFLIQN